jgi:hypothetical protein
VSDSLYAGAIDVPDESVSMGAATLLASDRSSAITGAAANVTCGQIAD